MKIERPPRIALIGYGKMGREIESVAQELDVPIAAIIDTNISAKENVINAKSLSDVDVCIEFTQPDAVLANITAIALAGKHVVVGTTGWYHSMSVVEALVRKHDIGLVYASNFSLGMNLFYELVKQATLIFNPFDSYDCTLHESHHAKKKDSPSGSALQIAKLILEHSKSKSSMVTGDIQREKSYDELHVSSSRGGSAPGVHQVIFDSLADSVELIHTARNRRGFAEGALIAAEWIKDKKGLFTMENVLRDIKSV